MIPSFSRQECIEDQPIQYKELQITVIQNIDRASFLAKAEAQFTLDTRDYLPQGYLDPEAYLIYDALLLLKVTGIEL